MLYYKKFRFILRLNLVCVLKAQIFGNMCALYCIRWLYEQFHIYILVPGIPVPNFVVNDKESTSWWSVSWGTIPEEHTNGILLGYRLIYYLSFRSDIEVGGEKMKKMFEFDIFTFYYKVTNLVNYATYNVTVTGFTQAGNGPAPEYFASKSYSYIID